VGGNESATKEPYFFHLSLMQITGVFHFIQLVNKSKYVSDWGQSFKFPGLMISVSSSQLGKASLPPFRHRLTITVLHPRGLYGIALPPF